MPTIINLKDVRKLYRMGDEKIVALDKVNLSIEKGEVCCLLGTSGSGKSTLLNLIAGLEKPSSGSIHFHKYRVEKMNEKNLAKFRQKHIGFIFQSYNLLSTLTALENVTIPLIFNKTPRKIRNKRAAAMLKAVGLEKRMKHKPAQMSGGQQQRVSIARALVNNPELIIADEPTGNLDTKTTFEMMDMITDMVRKNNQTLILVTHDLEISKYADRIIYMRDGNIEKIENRREMPDTDGAILESQEKGDEDIDEGK